MTKERRLGRGLEALLGQLHPQGEAAPPPQQNRNSQSNDASSSFPDNASAGFAPQPRQMAAHEFDSFLNNEFSNQKTPTGGQRFDAPEQSAPSAETPGMQYLRIDQIDSNPDQPRQDFDPDELRELSESIASHGLLQPVVVRRLNNRYQVIAGERRLRAATLAGWTEVPVNLVEADDQQTAELAIIENLQRKDLNALEKAASFQRYLEQYGCTQEELASRLNLDRSTIANLIRLLELPEVVQDAIRQGDITQGHARALLPLGDEREQIAFCQRIKQEGLNVRQTESLVQDMINAVDQEPLAALEDESHTLKIHRGQNEQLAALEQEFRMTLGLKKVQLTSNARGRGKLVIYFRNHDEFDRIREQICGEIGPNYHSDAG